MSSKISKVKGKPFTEINPEADPQVAVRLFNVASTEISSMAQHHEMFEASTPPKETQAHVACPLSIKAQNTQESKPWELITHACKALRAIYAGWWLHKE